MLTSTVQRTLDHNDFDQTRKILKYHRFCIPNRGELVVADQQLHTEEQPEPAQSN